MPRPTRDPEELEQNALQQFYDWRNMEAVEQQQDTAVQFTATERNLHVTLPEPGEVTVMHPCPACKDKTKYEGCPVCSYCAGSGRVIVDERPMNEAERAAWLSGLDPELDEVKEGG